MSEQGTVREVRLEARHLPEYGWRVAKLNKRAAKIGVDPIEFTVTGHEAVTVDDEFVGKRVVEYVTLAVTGTIPRLPGGWVAVAVVEHTPAGNLIDLIDRDLAAEVAEQYRTAENTCDHCGTKRQRNKTFVVRSESEDVKRIGSTCLADYLGLGCTPESLVGLYREIGTLDEDEWGGYGVAYLPPARLIAAAAIADGHAHGRFRPASFDGITTKIVAEYLATGTAPRPFYDRHGKIANQDEIDYVGAAYTALDDDKDAIYAEADKVIAWAIDQAGKGEYLGNLAVACALESTDRYGLVASAPRAYEKAHEDEKAKADKVPAKPVPVSTGRLTIEGEVLSVSERETEWGFTWKMTVRHDDGWRVWSTVPSGLRPDSIVGKRVRFVAKIEVSDDDRTFGFAKRPTQAQEISA